MLHIKTFVFNFFEENTYVLWDDSLQGVVVDPGACVSSERSILLSFLKEKGISIEGIWLTHGHFDHIYGVRGIMDTYPAKAYMNPLEKETIRHNSEILGSYHFIEPPRTDFETEAIADGDTLSLGDVNFTVLATPGHTPGGVCFYCEKEQILFSGDTLFRGTIGRSDLPGGNLEALLKGIDEKLISLPSDTTVYPGHGPSSDIGYEISHNPMLEPLLGGSDATDGEDINPIELNGDY